MKDWRAPFKTLRDELLQIYNTSSEIHHAIVLSVHCDATQLSTSLDYLEPKLLGHRPLQDLMIHTEGCQFHSHRFFGSSNSSYYALQRALIGLEEWCDHVPGGFIPSLEIPKLPSQADRNLIRWMSLVYYLASVSQAPYLEMELEYQQNAEEIGFFPWYECPHPAGWSPFDWLIRKRSALSEIPRWKSRFEKAGHQLPDLIDAYLLDGVIRSSVAAVDILISVLPMERRSAPRDKDNDLQRSRSKTSVQKQKQGPRISSRKRQRQIADLCRLLRTYHDAGQIWFDDTNTVAQKQPFAPLNAKQWAQILKWEHKGGTPADSTVRRVMEDIFGKDPMETYKNLLTKQDNNRRFFNFLDDMLEQKGGQFYEGISKEEIKKYGRQHPQGSRMLESLQCQEDEEEPEDDD